MTISIIYELKWELKSNPIYKFTTCKKLVNCKSGKEIKKTKFGNSSEMGYYIDGKFVKYSELKKDIQKIKTEKPPF